MRPHFLIWSLGPKTGSVDGICHQTDSMNIFYLDVKTGPNTYNSRFLPDMSRFSMLDWVRVAGLSCTKGVWYIYDRDTG